MHLRTIVSVAMLVTLGVASISTPASAQTCNGTAPFDNARVHAGVTSGSSTGTEPAREGTAPIGYQFTLGAKHAVASFGQSIVLFTSSSKNRHVTRGFAATTTDDAVGFATTLTAGYGVNVSRFEVCAGPTFTRQTGPTLYRTCIAQSSGGLRCSDDVKGSARAWSFGGSVGTPVKASRNLALVPFVGAALIISRISTDAGSPPALDEKYGVINVGAGIVYRLLGVRMVKSFPVGLAGSQSTGSLDIGVSTGGKPK